ncbi:hypothetical protein GCK32_011221, partial [Trichostrongylus colubriformis]
AAFSLQGRVVRCVNRCHLRWQAANLVAFRLWRVRPYSHPRGELS